MSEPAENMENEIENEATDWREEAGIAGDPKFEKFQSPADLAKSYAELESMMGRSVRMPTDDASEEQWEQFYSKFENTKGLMRTPEGYEAPPSEPGMYEFENPDGFEADESVGEFKKVAHEAGLTRAQAAKIHGWLANNVVEDQGKIEEITQAEMRELKGEWGQAYDHKMQAARQTAHTLSEKVPGLGEFFDSMADNGMDAKFIRLMDVVGEALGESGAMKSDPRTTMTKQEAIDRITDIRNNPDHPANNEFDPKYEDARKQMMNLYKIAHG